MDKSIDDRRDIEFARRWLAALVRFDDPILKEFDRLLPETIAFGLTDGTALNLLIEVGIR